MNRHYKDTQRALEHSENAGTEAYEGLGHLKGTWSLGYSNGVQHSGSWALKGLETFCLADSLSLNVYHWFFKESNHLRAIFSKIDEIVVFSLK